MPPSTPRFCLTGNARFTTRDFESAGEEFELAVLRWGLTDAVFDALMERFIAAAPAESEVSRGQILPRWLQALARRSAHGRRFSGDGQLLDLLGSPRGRSFIEYLCSKIFSAGDWISF